MIHRFMKITLLVKPMQLNNLLTTMNLPSITKRTLKAREREIGNAIEKVTGKSVKHALEKEIQATISKYKEH